MRYVKYVLKEKRQLLQARKNRMNLLSYLNSDRTRHPPRGLRTNAVLISRPKGAVMEALAACFAAWNGFPVLFPLRIKIIQYGVVENRWHHRMRRCGVGSLCQTAALALPAAVVRH
jgi:hypothetical protein